MLTVPLVIGMIVFASLAALIWVVGFVGRQWFDDHGVGLRSVVLFGAAASAALAILGVVISATASPAPSPSISVSGVASPTAAQSCNVSPDAVTVFVEPHLTGECKSFNVGEYDLGDFANRVSSVLDPNSAFSWVLYNRYGLARFDATVEQLPADWNKTAISIKVERHAVP